MTRFETYQQSVRLHLTVALRALQNMENDPDFLDRIRWNDPETGHSYPAGGFDIRVLRTLVSEALDRNNQLEDTRHAEVHEDPLSERAGEPAAPPAA